MPSRGFDSATSALREKQKHALVGWWIHRNLVRSQGLDRAMSRGGARRGAVALGVLSLFALGVPSALAAFPGQNGRIVYAHIPHHSRDRGIYSARPSGKHRKQLTDGPFDGNPNVAPNGNRIVFDRAPHGDFEIWTMGANGHHRRQLTDGRSDVDPAFLGPRGRRIVFTRGPYHLVVMRADGSHVHRLHGTNRERMPASSPDGRWIAFSGRGRGTGGWHIYVVHPNGHGLRQLSSRGGIDTNPDFSPSGDRVVFNRYDRSSGAIRLWVVRTDGSHLHRLPITNADYEGTVAFSPSGSKITYGTASGRAIVVARDDGSHAKRVITNWVNRMPNWGVSP